MLLKQCPEQEFGNFKRVSFISRKKNDNNMRDKFNNLIKAVYWKRVWEL